MDCRTIHLCYILQVSFTEICFHLKTYLRLYSANQSEKSFLLLIYLCTEPRIQEEPKSKEVTELQNSKIQFFPTRCFFIRINMRYSGCIYISATFLRCVVGQIKKAISETWASSPDYWSYMSRVKYTKHNVRHLYNWKTYNMFGQLWQWQGST